MADDNKLSYHDYVAIAYADDAEGAWLWCQVAEAGKFTKDEDFYATVLNGQWQVKVMSKLRMIMVMQTGQMMPNIRVAYFGRVPAEISGHYDDIINGYLRNTKYVNWPGQSDPGF